MINVGVNVEVRAVIKDFTYCFRITDETGKLICYSSPANKTIIFKCLNKALNKMGCDEMTMQEFEEDVA